MEAETGRSLTTWLPILWGFLFSMSIMALATSGLGRGWRVWGHLGKATTTLLSSPLLARNTSPSTYRQCRGEVEIN